MIGNFSVKDVGLWRTVICFESSGVASRAGALNSPVGGFVSPVGGVVLLVSSLLLTSRKTRRSKRHDVQHKTVLTAVLGLCASETPRIAHPNVSARSKFYGMTPVGAAIRKPRHCRKRYMYDANPRITAGIVRVPRCNVSKGYFETCFHNRSCAPKNCFKVTFRHASPVRCSRDGHYSKVL